MHYRIEIIISIKGARPQIDHICKKNQQASDDVWVCQKFKRKRKKLIAWWEFVPIPERLFIWHPQKIRSKNNIEKTQ